MRNDIKKNQNTRNVKVELIRIIACFAVIWYHIRALPWKKNGELSETAVLFECICTICVMTFFLISGFYIYNKNGNIFKDWLKLIKNFFKNVFLPFICVVIFTIIFHNFLISTDTFIGCIQKFDAKKTVTILYDSFSHFSANYLPGTSAHLWYIFAYMMIIAVYPITRFILKKSHSIVLYLIVLVIFIIMILDDYYMLYDNPTINYFFNILPKPIFYSFYGSILYNDVIKKYIDDKDINDKTIIINKPLFFGSLIVYAVTFVFLFKTQCRYDLTLDKGYAYTSWLSTFSLVMTTAFILAIYNINIERFVNSFIKNGIYFIASRTLGVYLIHYLLITKFLSNGFQLLFSQNLSYLFQHFLYHIFYGLFIFIVSFAIVLIIEKLIYLISGSSNK